MGLAEGNREEGIFRKKFAMAVAIKSPAKSRIACIVVIAALLPIYLLNHSNARLFRPVQIDIAFNNFPTDHIQRAYDIIRFYHKETQINTALNGNGVLWLRGYIAQGEQYAIYVWHDITGFIKNEPRDAKFWYAVLRRIYELPYVPDRDVIPMSGAGQAPMPRYNKDVPISAPAIDRYPSIKRLFADLHFPPEEFGRPIQPLVTSPGLTQGRQ
jgi:hypothetical protein